MKRLIVTIIPLQPDLMPYAMEVTYDPQVDRNLKLIFEKSKYWT